MGKFCRDIIQTIFCQNLFLRLMVLKKMAHYEMMALQATFALAIAGQTCISSAFCSLLGSSPG